jgi:phosphoribosylformylglycinamidine synthase
MLVQVMAEASSAGIPTKHIGRTVNENKLTLPGGLAISLTQLRDAHEGFFPHWFA